MAQFKRREEVNPSLVEPGEFEDPRLYSHPMVGEAKIWEASARSKGIIRNMPLDKAQDLIFQAYESGTTPERQRELARQALALSRDCADALLLLADYAETPAERIDLFEQAVAAGRRGAGMRSFQEDVGQFWKVVETRPYMRAVERLAVALWAEERFDDAIDYFEDLLRLNPSDNQGIRYALVPILIESGRDADAERYLERFPEQTASWTYHRALLTFLREGDSQSARELFLLAMRFSPRIAEFLITAREMPPAPSYSQVGLEPEEVVYCRNSLGAWKSKPGAMDWIKSLAESLFKEIAPPQPTGPTLASRAKLFKLPQTQEVWEADCRQITLADPTNDNTLSGWVGIVQSTTTGRIQAAIMHQDEPDSVLLWDLLDAAMNAHGDPQRPSSLNVRPVHQWSDLEEPIKKIGVQLNTVSQFAAIDEAFANLTMQRAYSD